MSSESFPKKPEEENKISVDVINNDQALANEFNKIGNGNKNENDPDKNKKIPAERKNLFQKIGGAFSTLADNLETNLEEVMADPGRRALFYAGTAQIDKASRITPISSGKAQSPFGQIVSSLGEGVNKVKGERGC